MNEEIEKKIQIAGKSITVKYVSTMRERSDGGIEPISDFKLSLLLTDGLTAVANNKVLKASKGDVLFFRPDEHHYGRFLRSGIHKYLNFYIPEDLFSVFCEEYKSVSEFITDISPKRINHIKPSGESFKKISEKAKEIVDLLKADKEGNNIKIFSAFLDIALVVSELYEVNKKIPYNENMPFCVSTALNMIAENYAESLTVKEIAKRAGCSVAYLSETFKKHIGMTVYEYLTEYRINSAKKMLSENKNITEVCYDSGFGDCSNFIRTFKRYTGYTPLKYKKMLTS